MSGDADAAYDDLEVTVEFDQAMHRAFQTLPHNLRDRGNKLVFMLILMLLQIGLTVAVCWDGLNKGLPNVLDGGGVGGCFGLFYFVLQLRLLSVRHTQSTFLRPQRFKLGSEGLWNDCSNGWCFVPWSEMELLDERPPYMFIMLRNNTPKYLRQFVVDHQTTIGISTAKNTPDIAPRFIGAVRERCASQAKPASTPRFVEIQIQKLGQKMAEVEYLLTDELGRAALEHSFVDTSHAKQSRRRRSRLSLPWWIGYPAFAGTSFAFAYWIYSNPNPDDGFFVGLIVPGAVYWGILVLYRYGWRIFAESQYWKRTPANGLPKYHRLYRDGVLTGFHAVWHFAAWDQFSTIGANAEFVGLVRQNVAHLIPRSAFADHAAVTEFLELARRLQQQYLDRVADITATNPVVRPTDLSNPYAPPRG